MKHISLALSLIFLILLLTVPAAAADTPSDWAGAEVAQAVYEHLVPYALQSDYQSAITRQEFCTLIAQYLAAAKPRAETAPVSFSDTTDADVLLCASYGIVNGYGGGLFLPDKTISRAEAAKILRAAASAVSVHAGTDAPRLFADEHLIAPWAAAGVSWAYGVGVMNGVGGDRFDPTGSYTREQAILTVLRLSQTDLDAAPSGDAAAPQRTVKLSGGGMTVAEADASLGANTLSTRSYGLPNGDTVTMHALRAAQAIGGGTVAARTRCTGDSGTITYYENGTWHTAPLSTTTYHGSVFFVQIGRSGYVFFAPQQYRSIADGTLQAVDGRSGALSAAKTADGFVLSLTTDAIAAGCSAQFLTVTTAGDPGAWSDNGYAALWDVFSMDNSSRWCYDGFYYTTPSTYRPSGSSYYYRNNACYLAKHLLTVTGSRAAQDLAIAMADTMVLLQNADGYFATAPESTWLSGDYGIGAGFYDTRFNSDLMEILLQVYDVYGGDVFLSAMTRYADFFADYAAAHHRASVSGGFLVDDYWNPGGGRATHTSLNHQLAEISVAYQLSDLLERPTLAACADALLRGVTDQGADWLRADGNLHYCLYTDGAFGGTDYPYLTYNDLYRLQNLLRARGDDPQPVLQQLAASKLAWMQQNGISGYLGISAEEYGEPVES